MAAAAGYRLCGGMNPTTDGAGNTVGGVALTVWDSFTGGNQITDLLDRDGNVLPGQVTSAVSADESIRGRVIFQVRTAYAAPFVWDGDPTHDRWPVLVSDLGDLLNTATNTATKASSDATAATSTADQATATANSAMSTANATQAQQTQLMTVTPTIDELCFSFSPGTRSATPVWVAPFAGSIVWAAAVWQGYSVAASDTNYLTLALAKRVASDPATPLDIVAKTSKVTGGEAVTAMKGWILNGSAWSTANGTFAAGDVLSCRVDVTGTLSPLPGSPILTIRYKPYRAP